MNQKPKIIKKNERERREDAVLNRKRRASLTMLEILCLEFPEEAKRFIKKAMENQRQSV